MHWARTISIHQYTYANLTRYKHSHANPECSHVTSVNWQFSKFLLARTRFVDPQTSKTTDFSHPAWLGSVATLSHKGQVRPDKTLENFAAQAMYANEHTISVRLVVTRDF